MKSDISLVHFGASFQITVTGEPDEVAQKVNRFSNFGIITGIDEDYKEGISKVAKLSSYEKPFEAGIRAMANVNVREKLRKSRVAKLYSRRMLKPLLKKELEEIRASFRDDGYISNRRAHEKHGTVYGVESSFRNEA